MSFLNPALLIGLLAAALPVLIHLLNKRRHRTVKWGAMQFILRATRESRGHKKLRHLIILACRALAVACIIFAIARPLVSSLMGFSGGRVETVVFLLDRSVSMEIAEAGSDRSKRQAAIDRVVSSIDQLGGARLILIDSATLVPQEVPDPAQLGTLTDVQATGTAANIPAMIEAATSYIRSADTGRTEIWLASDMQRSSWSPDDGRWATSRTSLAELPNRPRLRILSYEGVSDDNIAVSVPRVRRSGDDLLIDVSLSRREDRLPTEVPISFSIDGASFTATYTMEGQNLSFTRSVKLPSGNIGGTGAVSLIPDANPSDNAAYFTYQADTPVDVAVFTEDISLSRTLELMSAPPGFGNVRSTTLRTNQVENTDLSIFAAIVWQGPLPSEGASDRIEGFVRSGGQLLLLPARQESDTSFLDFTWGAIQAAPEDQFFVTGDWEEKDGVLRDSGDGTSLPVQKIRALQRRNLIGEQLTPIATWDSGETMVARRIVDAGRIVAITTLPDYQWSNLADGSVLLPALQRMIEQGAARFGGTHTLIAGTTRAAALPGESAQRLDGGESSISDPLGINPGLFTFGERQVAISRPADEDDWELLSDVASREVLRDTGATFSIQSTEDDSSLAREIWRAFLIACLLLLIAEAVLCLPKAVSTKPSTAPSTT